MQSGVCIENTTAEKGRYTPEHLLRHHLRNSKHSQDGNICTQLCIPGALNCRRGRSQRKEQGQEGLKLKESLTLNDLDNIERDAEKKDAEGREGEVSLDIFFWSSFSTNDEHGSCERISTPYSMEQLEGAPKTQQFTAKWLDKLLRVTDYKQKLGEIQVHLTQQPCWFLDATLELFCSIYSNNYSLIPKEFFSTGLQDSSLWVFFLVLCTVILSILLQSFFIPYIFPMPPFCPS